MTALKDVNIATLRKDADMEHAEIKLYDASFTLIEVIVDVIEN